MVLLLTRAQAVLGVLASLGASRARGLSSGTLRMSVDSHLHVWSSAHPFAPGQDPGPKLGDAVASAEALLEQMDANGVQTSVIVQPAVYKFDHEYCLDATRRYPDRFKLCLLADPTKAPDAAVEDIRSLAAQGACGVRFNPYLWPEGAGMDDACGSAMFAECGRHSPPLPVGIMAFKGLAPLLPAIRKLAAQSPSTPIVLDHWGFFRESPAESPAGQAVDEEAWNAMLQLCRDLPQVHVKISALFRVSSAGAAGGYADLEPRFRQLLDVCGSDRLLFGSDFPFVMLEENGGYRAAIDAVRSWAAAAGSGAASASRGDTARRLYGIDA